MLYRAGDTGGAVGGHTMTPPPPTPTFLHSKNKKGRQREKGKGFKAETIKRLSPRSKYYCFNHSRASRIRKFFSVPWSPYFEIHFAGPALEVFVSFPQVTSRSSNIFIRFIKFEDLLTTFSKQILAQGQ